VHAVLHNQTVWLDAQQHQPLKQGLAQACLGRLHMCSSSSVRNMAEYGEQNTIQASHVEPWQHMLTPASFVMQIVESFIKICQQQNATG